MRFEHDVVYTHPVLRSRGNDYSDQGGEFQATIHTPTLSGPRTDRVVQFEWSFELTVPEITRLLHQKRARAGVLVECRYTYYYEFHAAEMKADELFEQSHISMSGTICSIPKTNLREKVEVWPVVFVTEEIKEYTSTHFAADFRGLTFDLAAGSYLAYDDPEVFYVTPRSNKTTDSIISFEETRDLGDKPFKWNIATDGNKIMIQVSPQLNEVIQLEKATNIDSPALWNSFYMPALMQAAETLKDMSKDEIEDKEWARVIERKCAEYDLDYNDTDPLIIAQALLKYPAEKLAEAWRKESDDGQD